MKSFKNLFNLLLVFLCYRVDPINAKELPFCTSHDLLCEVNHKAWPIPPNEYSLPTSEYFRSVCICPGDVSCSDSYKVFNLEIPLPEERITARLDYCDALVIPERTCNKTEIALTFRGLDKVPTEIVGDVKCQCSGLLVLEKTILEPDSFDYLKHFTCGKPTCDACKSDPQACERVTTTDSGLGQVNELPCRCPYGYSCDRDPSQLPVDEGEAKFYCKRTGNTTVFA